MIIAEKYLNPFTDVGNFSREELADYENSLKHYRDMKNVLDTAVGEGEVKGRYEKAVEVARQCLADGLSMAQVMRYSGLSEAEIEALRQP